MCKTQRDRVASRWERHIRAVNVQVHSAALQTKRSTYENHGAIFYNMTHDKLFVGRCDFLRSFVLQCFRRGRGSSAIRMSEHLEFQTGPLSDFEKVIAEVYEREIQYE